MDLKCNPLISVVMPVYNGNRYLRETLLSILNQDFLCFELVCVDDCSTDGSLDTLHEFSAMDSRVSVFRTGHNLGAVPLVLNYIAKETRGMYYVYTSQDDLFSTDWLSSMYQRALDTDADAVVPNVCFYCNDQHDNENDRFMSGVYSDARTILSGKEAFVQSLDWTISGNALWKIRFLKDYGYYDFCAFSDEYTVRVWYLRCKVVAFSHGTFYYRQDNENAITKKFDLNSFDYPYNQFMLLNLAHDVDVPCGARTRLLKGATHALWRCDLKRHGFPGSEKKLMRCLELANKMDRAGCFDGCDVSVLRKYLLKLSLSNLQSLNLASSMYKLYFNFVRFNKL